MKQTSPSHYLLYITFAVFSVFNVYGQGGTCATIEPFCSSSDPLIFENCFDTAPAPCTTDAEVGPDYGCLFTQPNPAWFFLQIDQTGDLAFDIVQNTSFDAMGNPNGTTLDVDFIAWGPFDITDDLCDYANLQAGNQVGCSYSISAVEPFAITGALPGQIYVLLITNFDGDQGFIKLEQTNFGDPGSGATDCSILQEVGCAGTPLILDATTAGANNYIFTFDDGVNPPVEVQNANNPTFGATQTGTYEVLIEFPGGASTMQTFNVTINPQPIIAAQPIDIFICDTGTGSNLFNLRDNDDDVLGTQDPIMDFEVTYHNTQMDANMGTMPIPNPDMYMVTGGMETIYVRIADQASGTCFATASFDVEYSEANVEPLLPLDVCDEDGDGTVSLDLQTIKNSEALGAQDPLDYRVSYHGSQMDADMNAAPFANPYITSNATETIFVRVESRTNANCFDTGMFDTTLVVAPSTVQPAPFNICDELPNDGFGEFDLSTKTDEITGGANPNASVTYHVFRTDAEMATVVNPIMGVFTNTIISFQTVYARVANMSAPTCFTIVEVDLFVNDSPTILDPIPDYVECDNDQDGVELFDLPSRDVLILDGLVNVVLTYHTTQADADAGVAPIMGAGSYPSGGEIIWVRAQNFENGDPMGTALCHTVSSFNLVLGGVLAFSEVSTFESCDNDGDGMVVFDLASQNDLITMGNGNLNVTYFPSEMDAMLETNALALPYDSSGEVIWVRVETNASGCFRVFTMDLIVVAAPSIFMPDPLIFCDDNNDGFGEFMLDDATEQVKGGNPAGNLEVSYHISMADADNGVLPLDTMTPFFNDMVGMQTVFALLTDTATGCYSITALDLIVRDSPAISAVSPLVVCDDNDDGEALFDLTDAQEDLLDGLDASLYSVMYFDDPGLTNAINNPTAYVNTSNPQVIYIVVSNTDPGMPANDCQVDTTVVLEVVSPAFLVAPTPLESCDDTEIVGVNDELELFDLSSKVDQITGGDVSINITFYETLAAAQSGMSMIDPSTMYQNLSNPQTIYIRAEDTNTGCVLADGMVTLDLIVNPVPVLSVPSPLQGCDDDTDGIITDFDLESKNIEITSDPDVSFSYHESFEDAELNQFAVTGPYENIVADNQQLFVRVEYTVAPNDTGCFSITTLDLEVLSAPQVSTTLPPLSICDDDATGVFNLEDQSAIIYNGQNTDFVLSYHVDMLDAELGQNAISNTTSYENLTNPQTIFVRLSDPMGNGCFNTGSFDLQVNLGPIVIDPTQLVSCDDLGMTNDEMTAFDLTTKNDEITGATPGVSVEYYESMDDAQMGIDRINPETSYTNTVNPQTVFVRVIASNGCEGFTSLELRVTANPEPVTPASLELCDDNNPGDGIEEFNLAQTRAEILNGAGWSVTYHATQADALAGTPEVLDELVYPNVVAGMDVAYARVTNATSLCFEIVEIALIVHPLPDDSAMVDDYVICEVPFDGVASFDLESRVEDILGADQDPLEYSVSYYLSAADAIAGFPVLANTTTYQNLMNPQEIFTGITNRTTGCYIGGVQSFMIEVRPGAEATMPSASFVICDNQGDNDGIGSFDLTDISQMDVADLRAEILGGQLEPDFSISFHQTPEGAEDGTDAIGFPYTNLLNPQRLYVRVTNTMSDCYATTQMLLQVELLPVVVLDEQYRICVDQDDMVVMEQEGDPSPPTIDTGLDPLFYSFEWSIDGAVQVDELSPSIVPLVGGVYSVVVTDLDTSCENMASTTVIVSSAPFSFTAELTNGAFASNHIIELMATGFGDYLYQLDDGPYQVSTTFENVDPGVHVVRVKDVNGCGSDELEVSIIDYPQFVTPNSDGYHDTWNIIGIGDGDSTAKIYIFDRYGKLLKQLSPSSPGWDGTFNGNPLPSSDYWFRVEYTEDDTQKEFKGHFTLKR